MTIEEFLQGLFLVTDKLIKQISEIKDRDILLDFMNRKIGSTGVYRRIKFQNTHYPAEELLADEMVKVSLSKVASAFSSQLLSIK